MNDLSWINLSTYFRNPNIQAFFSLSSLEIAEKYERRRFAEKVGFKNKKLIIPNQIHSNQVNFCYKSGNVKDCDGVFSNNPNNICSLQVADCLPIFFAHHEQEIFGIVHVGWRGLVKGILDQCAKLLFNKKYHLSKFDIIIGPSIQRCCFEVKDDIIDKFDSVYVSPHDKGKYNVDLQSHALDNLFKAGFKVKNVHLIKDCTFCNNKKYHSYRRDGKNAGRMIGLIGTG
tara:strand:- start:1150 stop:1836 length:687 start_codon:yes stop_codon:yes gene_type:complete